MPFRQVEGAARQQLQAALQPIQDGAGRQYFDSGSRQLDRQRQSIQPRTDFLNRGRVFRGNRKIGPDGCRALRKQLNGGILRKRRYREFLFAINPQARPAGDQDLERWAGFQCFGHHGRGREDLFEVVQHEQERSRVLQLIADELRDGAVGDLLDFERVRESGCHQVRVRDGSQTDKLNARREPVRNGGGYSDRQPRFSGASRAREAQKPDIRPEQQFGGFRQLLFASDERSARGWQIVALLGLRCGQSRLRRITDRQRDRSDSHAWITSAVNK